MPHGRERKISGSERTPNRRTRNSRSTSMASDDGLDAAELQGSPKPTPTTAPQQAPAPPVVAAQTPIAPPATAAPVDSKPKGSTKYYPSKAAKPTPASDVPKISPASSASDADAYVTDMRLLVGILSDLRLCFTGSHRCLQRSHLRSPSCPLLCVQSSDQAVRLAMLL